MRITQRQAIISLFILQIVSGLAGLIFFVVFNQRTQVVGLSTALVIILLLFALYSRGWKAAQYANIIVTTGVITTALINPAVDRGWSAVVIAPAIIAFIIAGPAWIVGTAATTLGILLLRGQGQGPYYELDSLLAFVFCVGALVVGRMIFDTARGTAEENAQQANAERTLALQQTEEVQRQAEELRSQNENQRRLLDLVSTLETPAITVADGVLLAPLVGSMDERRAGAITERLLDSVYAQRTRLVILDVAGVTDVDGVIAQALITIAQAVRLLGCRVIISGISAEVATTLTQQSASLNDIETVRSPQEALAMYQQPVLG